MAAIAGRATDAPSRHRDRRTFRGPRVGDDPRGVARPLRSAMSRQGPPDRHAATSMSVLPAAPMTIGPLPRRRPTRQ